MDLGYNCIASVHGVSGSCLLSFQLLTDLDLGFNKLSSLEDVIAIAK